MSPSILSFLAVSSLVLGGAEGAMMQGQPRVIQQSMIQEKTSPISEVISLMETMKGDLEADGRNAAATYKVVSCGCKSQNVVQSENIVQDNNKIAKLAGEIEEDEAEEDEKEKTLSERKADQQAMTASLNAEVVRFAKLSAEYEANSVDSAKGIASLTRAIDTMKKRYGSIQTHGDTHEKQETQCTGSYGQGGDDAQHDGGTDKWCCMDCNCKDKADATTCKESFIQVSLNDLFEDGVVPQHAKLSDSVVAQDPAYKYHSAEITNLLETSLESFNDDKDAEDLAWGKTKEASEEEKMSIAAKMSNNMAAMSTLEEGAASLVVEIKGETKQEVKTAGRFEDESAQLKSATKACEAAATEFDRQATLNSQVVTALGKVLEFLGETSTATDNAGTSASKEITDVTGEAGTRITAIAEARAERRADVGLDFLQTAPVMSLLAQGRSMVEQAKVDKVTSLLRDTSIKVTSPELSMLVMNIGTEKHFNKVESMIHNLISKLLSENDREISKDGFCKTEIAKGNKARVMAKQKADGKSADLSKLESNKERLEVELRDMATELEEDRELVEKLVTMRSDTKDKNTLTIKHAKDGIIALEKAKTFYKEAAGLQDTVAIETTPQAGTAEERVGTGAKAVVALFQTITLDFHKQVREVEADDKENQANFVGQSQAIKENIEARETETKMDTADLKTTDDKISKTMDDLETQQGLMNDANVMVADLKPACLDAGGMNFNTRKVKRDEEIAALNKAMAAIKA